MKEVSRFKCDCGRTIQVKVLNRGKRLQREVESVCEACGVVFLSDFSGARFCSKRCVGSRRYGLFPLSDEEIKAELDKGKTWRQVGKENGFTKGQMCKAMDRLSMRQREKEQIERWKAELKEDPDMQRPYYWWAKVETLIGIVERQEQDLRRYAQEGIEHESEVTNEQ